MLSRFSTTVLFFLLFFTPLAFGTVEPWSYAVMEILTAAGISAGCLSLLKNKEELYETPGIFALVLFLMYILFQIMPLPPFIVNLLSPHSHAIQERASVLTGQVSWMTLSLNPRATLFEFFRLGTYAAFYAMTVQVLKEKSRLQTLVLSIAAFGGILAVSSILQFYLTRDMALWFRHSPANSIIVGPYINHNHYAGLMEMIFPVVLALFFFYRPRIGQTSLIRGIVEILNQEKANIHILIGTCALLIVVSIFVSLSRGGMLSTCGAMVLFFYLMLKRRISRGNTILVFSLAVLAGLSIAWFGWDQIIDRFAMLKKAQGVIYDGRMDFWKNTADIIKDFPLTGSGLGTFIHVHPLYKSLVDRYTLTHAHNDYLELLAEGGVVGFFIAAAFLVSLFVKTYPVFLKRRDGFSIYIYMGSLTGMVALLFHSFTDFNLHIGANGLWFFFLAGLAVSSAHTNIRRKTAPTRLRPITRPAKKNAVIFMAILFAMGSLWFNVSGLTASLYLRTIQDVEINRFTDPVLLAKIRDTANFVTRLDPLHGEPRYIEANASWLLKDPTAAQKKFHQALILDPVNSRYLKRLAAFLVQQGMPEKADLAFALGATYSPTRPEYAFQYGTWLLSKGDRAGGIRQIRTTLELDDTFTDQALTAMILSGLDAGEMRQAVPDKPVPFLKFAQFLYTTGEKTQASLMYLQVLDMIETQDRINAWQFLAVYRFFTRQGNIKNAEQTLIRAEQALPENPDIKVTFGDLYKSQGILYKAREKYEQALYLDPGNQKAKKKLQDLENQ